MLRPRQHRMVRPWYDYRWCRRNSMRGVNWTGIEAKYVPYPPLVEVFSFRGNKHYAELWD